MKKLILNFKSKDSKKIKNPKNFLGGKGANLSEMGRMGLPVPPGFIISTKVCELFEEGMVSSAIRDSSTQKFQQRFSEITLSMPWFVRPKESSGCR